LLCKCSEKSTVSNCSSSSSSSSPSSCWLPSMQNEAAILLDSVVPMTRPFSVAYKPSPSSSTTSSGLSDWFSRTCVLLFLRQNPAPINPFGAFSGGTLLPRIGEAEFRKGLAICTLPAVALLSNTLKTSPCLAFRTKNDDDRDILSEALPVEPISAKKIL
jgi:hypothetical protein